MTSHIYLVAGEHSGDRLGGKLMAALKVNYAGKLEISGVGGEAMAQQGLRSLFPLSEVAVMGPLAILPKLPRIVSRVYQTRADILAKNPDILVILDSPEFTHPIAKRVRKSRPNLPIIDYVSPSVWAWRPGRAKKMRAYVDHVLALLPFEPAAHDRLGGPPCSYVGHPLIEQMDWIDGLDPSALAKRLKLQLGLPVIVVLPGSRSSEVSRLLEPFGKTVVRLAAAHGPLEIVMPVVPSVRRQIEQGVAEWPIAPHIVEGEQEKFQAFGLARAALAASGTVTLELALAGAPMVVAYRIDVLSAAVLRRMIKAPSAVLANLILEKNAFPEFIQEDCTPDRLAAALLPLIGESNERNAQLKALSELRARMRIGRSSPSDQAADIVLGYLDLA